MSLRRPIRCWYCSVLVFALLFMQCVTAAHACPLMAAASEPVQAMPCAESMQDASGAASSAQPMLCIKHCQPDSGGMDAGHAPALSAPAVLSMLMLAPLDERAGAFPLPRGTEAAERATPPPSLSILNCCWRI